MGQIISGEATAAQIAAFLMGLRIKGETIDEIVGLRDAVLAAAAPLAVPSAVVDIVGTGGDPYGAVLNISSVAAIVIAACGVPVVKHGNRAASSKSGATDFLDALGLRTDLTPSRVAEVFHTVGLTFAAAVPSIRDLRTCVPSGPRWAYPLFNVLGPLCNPARPDASAVGVANLERAPLIAGVFRARDTTALVFRGDDGIDKLTTTGHSHIWEISHGSMHAHDLDPTELGLPRVDIEAILGSTPVHNATLARAVLSGNHGPVRDIVLLNAAAGLVTDALSRQPQQFHRSINDRFRAALDRAAHAVNSGIALDTLDRWIAATTTN